MAKNEADAKAASEDPITRFAQSLASAANADNKESNPFHGYYFRIVTENSAAGVSSHGKRTRGLTLVAYPAEYHSSGVKTFVVAQRGVVFEKDLGPDNDSRPTDESPHRSKLASGGVKDKHTRLPLGNHDCG